MPRVALVGAGGFIGRHVRQALDAHRRPPLLLSRADAAGEAPRLRRSLVAESVDVLVNCAGTTRGSKAELQAANVTLVATLLEALAGTTIRLIQIGSAAEYGPGEAGHLVREDHGVHPLSDYGISKLAATRLVFAAADQSEVPGVVLRVFNPIGPGISPESLPGRAALQIRGALRGGAVHLGPLGATRDFVDVRDVADAVAAACFADAVSGRVLNIGSGQATTARELVHQLAAVADYAGPIIEDAAASPRSEAVDWQVAEIGAAGSALGWAPRRSLRDALTSLWEAG